MDSLRQRLKELDREKFEELIFCLIKARHPDANIHCVEGASGDQGVDTFAGDLAQGSAIWQAKSFRDGIGKSQKQQIRDSLRQAVRHHHPGLWILCVSVNLDIKAHLWFQKVAKSYADKVRIGLMQASEIASELMHRKTIRDRFFPEAGLNINELRALITKTGEYSDEELANLTTENASQYIERLKARDARFDYEVVITTDRPPTTAGDPVFSINAGTITINAYARDTEALRADPVRLHVTFQGAGVDKIGEYIKTGRATDFDFDAEELTSLRTTLGFPELNGARTLHLGPRASKKPLPTRVTFGNTTRGVVYDLITFAITSAGTEEIQLTSTGKLPFTLSVIARDKQGTFTIDEHMTGAPLSAVKKYADALIALKHTGELQLYDLEDERPIFYAAIDTTSVPTFDSGLVRLISDASIVAKAYDADIRMPELVTREDAETIAFLKNLLDGTMPGVNGITSTVIKDDAADRWINDVGGGNKNVGITLSHQGMTRSFGGSPIETGAFDVVIDQVRFNDPQQTIKDYQATPVGAAVTVTFIPVTPPRAQRRRAP